MRENEERISKNKYKNRLKNKYKNRLKNGNKI